MWLRFSVCACKVGTTLLRSLRRPLVYTQNMLRTSVTWRLLESYAMARVSEILGKGLLSKCTQNQELLMGDAEKGGIAE